MPTASGSQPPDAGKARRRVLVVDPDYDTLAALAGALRGRGIEVILAADGRTGLERAVVAGPDVVLVDVAIPLVDIRTFLEVLRGNPRTSSVPVFVMGEDDLRRLPFQDTREGAFAKPFQVDEVAARIDAVLAERGRRRARDGADLQVAGDLAQVPLADILQVFSINRRTGTFELRFQEATGAIALRDGDIVNARFGPAAGMKALVRMLAERSGRFQFVPDRAPTRGNLHGTTDALLVEALRQTDELARLRPELPPLHAILTVRRSATVGVAPAEPEDEASRTVLSLAAEPRSLASIFDQSGVSDFDTALAVASLLRSGRLAVRSAGAERVPLANADELTTLRGRVQRARRNGMPGAPRLLVPLSDAQAAARLVGSLSWVADFAPEATPLSGEMALGALGTLRLGEGVEVVVYAVPTDPLLRPCWAPFAPAAMCAIVIGSMEERETVDETVRYLREEADVPFCARAWTGAWPGTVEEGDLFADGLETAEGTAALLRDVLGKLGA